MQLTFATGNQGKFEEARIILDEFDLQWAKLDLEEIQGSPEEIAKHKAMQAYEAVKAPVFVEDTAVYCDCLGSSLPGVYIKFFLESMGPEGLADLVYRYENHAARAVCVAALMMPGWEEPQLFEGVLAGQIVKPKGNLKHGKISWNPIFQPEGCEETMGEITMEQHAELSHRFKALELMRRSLQEVAHERA